MKTVFVICDGCKTKLQVDDESLLGQDMPCPRCGASVYIPLPDINLDNTGGKRFAPRSCQKENKSFKEPILSMFYRASGIFSIAMGVIIFLAAILILVTNPDDTSMIRTTGGCVLAFALVISGLFLIGIAQIFGYIGKTAFCAERAVELLSKRK